MKRLATDVSQGDTLLVGAFLGACVFAVASTVADPDMFHVLSIGREIVAERRVPLDDAFAYTPTRTPVVRHEWLFGVVLDRLVVTGGASGLMAFKWGLHLLTVGLVLAVARARGASIVTMAFLAPYGIGLVALGMTTLRAQALTLCCTAATLACTELDRRGSRRWMAPYALLHVVWLNCHGGFVMGPALLALHAFEQALRRQPTRHLVLLLAALGLLVLVNPYGLAYPRYLWEALPMDRSNVGEWRPLGTDHPWALPIWGFSLLVFVYAWLPDGPRAHPGWLLVTVSGVAAYLHQRHVSLYALAWLAAVPPMVERRRMAIAFRRVWFARPWLARMLLVAGLAAAALDARADRWWTVTVPTRLGADPHLVYPVGVVTYLRDTHVTGNLVTPFELGAFVSWHCSPAIKVSLDGRYEAAYAAPRALADAHVDFYAARGTWRTFLYRHATDLVLARRTDPLVAGMRKDAAWPLVYEDDAFVLFARTALGLPVVDRRGIAIVGSFP